MSAVSGPVAGGSPPAAGARGTGGSKKTTRKLAFSTERENQSGLWSGRRTSRYPATSARNWRTRAYRPLESEAQAKIAFFTAGRSYSKQRGRPVGLSPTRRPPHVSG